MKKVKEPTVILRGYDRFLEGVTALLEVARRQAARSVNAILTATYWEIGRRIVEYEQAGKERAGYGDALMKRLSGDLTKRFGRGFGVSHIKTMRQFYAYYRNLSNRQSVLGRSRDTEKRQSLIGESGNATMSRPTTKFEALATAFPLSWTHYARLLRVRDETARTFYETEALRGGWSVRQLDRQIESQFL